MDICNATANLSAKGFPTAELCDSVLDQTVAKTGAYMGIADKTENPEGFGFTVNLQCGEGCLIKKLKEAHLLDKAELIGSCKER